MSEDDGRLVWLDFYEDDGTAAHSTAAIEIILYSSGLIDSIRWKQQQQQQQEGRRRKREKGKENRSEKQATCFSQAPCRRASSCRHPQQPRWWMMMCWSPTQDARSGPDCCMQLASCRRSRRGRGRGRGKIRNRKTKTAGWRRRDREVHSFTGKNVTAYPKLHQGEKTRRRRSKMMGVWLEIYSTKTPKTTAPRGGDKKKIL